MFDSTFTKALAAIALAAAGALIIAKPERAWLVIVFAITALLVGYIAGWINDEIRNRNDDDRDGFA